MNKFLEYYLESFYARKWLHNSSHSEAISVTEIYNIMKEYVQMGSNVCIPLCEVENPDLYAQNVVSAYYLTYRWNF